MEEFHDRDINVCHVCKTGKNDARLKQGVYLKKIFICDECVRKLGGYEVAYEIAEKWE